MAIGVDNIEDRQLQTTHCLLEVPKILHSHELENLLAPEGFGKVGVTIMDHPSSFRYPTHWHVRDYGLVGANAFGYSYFYGNDSGKNGDHLLKQGESLTFNYRIYIHTGDVKEANVAEQYDLFKNSNAEV